MPSAIGIGGKTRQNDLDIAFQFTFFTGADSGCALSSVVNSFNSTLDCDGNGAGGANTLNIRQAYMTFGDASWGTIKLGRDLGIFGSDAILNDMTLLGVGVGAGVGGSSTLGRIGSGYMYADWVGQISYHSPNWNGFSFRAGVREPWTNGDSNDIQSQTRHDMGFEANASYEWAGDVSGKVWTSYITQKHENGWWPEDYRADGWEVGGKVSFSGLTLVGNYYEGDGLGKGLMFLTGNPYFGNTNEPVNKSDDDGYYVQATYVIPGIGTKIGASYGESNSESKFNDYDLEDKSWIVGVYHPLTKSLNLVAEYTDRDIEDREDGFDAELRTISLGAILFF